MNKRFPSLSLESSPEEEEVSRSMANDYRNLSEIGKLGFLRNISSFNRNDSFSGLQRIKPFQTSAVPLEDSTMERCNLPPSFCLPTSDPAEERQPLLSQIACIRKSSNGEDLEGTNDLSICGTEDIVLDS